MLSSLLHQVAELKKEVQDHGQQLEHVRSGAARDKDLDDKDCHGEESHHREQGSVGGVHSGCQPMLNRLQSQIKQNTFKLNWLHMKVDQHTASIARLQQPCEMAPPEESPGNYGLHLSSHTKAAVALSAEFHPRSLDPSSAVVSIDTDKVDNIHVLDASNTGCIPPQGVTFRQNVWNIPQGTTQQSQPQSSQISSLPAAPISSITFPLDKVSASKNDDANFPALPRNTALSTWGPIGTKICPSQSSCYSDASVLLRKIRVCAIICQ